MDDDFSEAAMELAGSLISNLPLGDPPPGDEPFSDPGQRHVPRRVALLILAVIFGIPLLSGVIWWLLTPH